MPRQKLNPVEAGSVPPPPPKKSPFASLDGGPKGWKPAAEVLDRVTAVRTCFPDYDRALRVGGHPVRRVTTVHGPTHGGKSAFVAGLLRSFVDQGHPAASALPCVPTQLHG